MKKRFGIVLITAFIISASCGLTIWKLQLVDNTARAFDDTSSTQVSSNMNGTWHHVITFAGASYAQTDPFYIDGDKFRVKYTATPLFDAFGNQTDDRSFIVVQVKKQLQSDNFLYGHINENLNVPVNGILNVDQGNGYYYLLIWDMSFANWQIEVESYN